TANNQIAIAEAKGHTWLQIPGERPQNSIKVEDVLYVPQLVTNILSLSKIAQKGYEITFYKQRCTIIDEEDLGSNDYEVSDYLINPKEKLEETEESETFEDADDNFEVRDEQPVQDSYQSQNNVETNAEKIALRRSTRPWKPITRPG
ncbi:hypothetical protein KPH14_012946, partial [Odynerus spinipes]